MARTDRYFWYCEACGEQNSRLDGECQFCECQGPDCKRDSCSEPQHFHLDHLAEEPFFEGCPLCIDKVARRREQ